MKCSEKGKGICKVQRLVFGLLFTLILGSLGISADIPVLQAAQKQEEMEQELPTGGVDEPRVYRVDAAAAEHVPSYDNQFSFFSRTTSVFEAGTGDYGYNRLSDDQKAFYMSLEISLKNFENSDTTEFTEAWGGRYTPFKVEYASKNLDDEQAGQVWTAFHSDHPWLFWLNGYMVSFGGSGEYLMPKVVDEYKNDLPRIKKIYALIEDGVSDYLDAVSGIDTAYEKVRIIYDRIIHNVDYAYQSDGTTPETANWAHSIVGVFDPSHKSAVCEGYAKTFSFLMNILDIPNVYIAGATQSDGGGRHAWNAVSFDGGGSYYYMDVTWDDAKKNSDQPQNLYIYFAMPKSVFEKDHFADGPQSGYWQYDLPEMEDNMGRSYFQTYGAYGTKDVVWDDKSAEEFIKQAGALSPKQGRLILLVDTDTYDKIKTSLGPSWYYAYSKEDGYKVTWAELPERFRVDIPAKALTLSPTEISMDMNGASKPLSATVSIGSVTQNSDDYIQVSSSDEKVVTVDAPFVKAKQDWSPASIRLTGHSAGTATIYARSASGGATASCKVVVKPKVSPSPSPTPSNPPFSGTLSNPRVNSDGVTTWDCVYFGNYWQEDTNGDGKADRNDEKTPIKWRVLSVDGDDVFLLADQNLDCQKYNDTYTDVTWETCTMRSWLNGYGVEVNEPGEDFRKDNFLDNAFTGSEQAAIKTSNVVNDDNPEYGTEGGNDTSDKVYLLSIDEAVKSTYGFASDYGKYDETRRAKNTAYTKTQGAYTSLSEEYIGNGWWWLRSLGNNNRDASLVSGRGYVYRIGGSVDINSRAVRPVLHLNLSFLSSWSYAGTVGSNGTVTKPAPVPTVVPPPTGEPLPTPSRMPFSSNLANPKVNSDGVAIWDCVYFGNYWQEDTNGDGKADKNDAKQPIKWRVLSVDGDDAFLLADKNLDVQPDDDASTDVKWDTCMVRSWLNGYGAGENDAGKNYSGIGFINDAFASEEQLAIWVTKVVNDDNPFSGAEGGNDTLDQVYLLSLNEALDPLYGFSTDYSVETESRKAKSTKYAKLQGVWIGHWLLRSTGYWSDAVLCVGDDGGIGNVMIDGGSGSAIRPVLHLKLSSTAVWSYAGTVASDGTVTEPAPVPTVTPTQVPSFIPTAKPTAFPTKEPSPDAEPSPTPLPATATPKPTNTPDISPPEHPGITPTTQPLPTVDPTPTPKPTEQPTFSPGDTSSPTESPTPPPEDTSSPTETPKPTSSSEPSKQPPQTTLVPSVTAAPNPNEISVPDNGIEKRLKKGDSFVAGNIRYRVTKLKGKKGEAAVAGVKSKKSKSFVIPQKVKKEGVTFMVTSIQKNAFKGCKKAKTLTIKSTSIRGITKKALAGLVKQIRIRIPKSKTAQYWSVLRKLGYSKVNW